MNISITEAPAEHSLHGTDEVWVQATTGPEDQLLDWPTIKVHIAQQRPDLALPELPKAYYPGDHKGPDDGILYLEDYWVFERKFKTNAPKSDQWGML